MEKLGLGRYGPVPQSKDREAGRAESADPIRRRGGIVPVNTSLAVRVFPPDKGRKGTVAFLS